MHEAPSLLLVGESPPPGSPPSFRPFDCDAGDRLARLLCGLRSRAPLLDHVARSNIFDEPGVGLPGGPKWDRQAAVDNAAEIAASLDPRPGTTTIVALGRRPTEAFIDFDLQFGSWHRLLCNVDLVAIPHPSGRSTKLHEPGYLTSMRRAMLCELVIGCPGLRPWHFRLDEPEVLVDLAHAVAPHHPARAAAALVIAAEVFTTWVREKGPSSGIIDHDDVDRPLRVLSKWCRNFSTLVDQWSPTGSPSRKVATEVRSREKFVNTTLGAQIAAYSPDAIRATYGRHVARGIA